MYFSRIVGIPLWGRACSFLGDGTSAAPSEKAIELRPRIQPGPLAAPPEWGHLPSESRLTKPARRLEAAVSSGFLRVEDFSVEGQVASGGLVLWGHGGKYTGARRSPRAGPPCVPNSRSGSQG